MASRSGSLAAQIGRPMSTQKDKAHRGNRKTSPRRKSFRIVNKPAIEKGSTHQTDTKQQEEQPVGVDLSRRSLRPRTANHIQTASFSGQKAATRKRPPEAEVEQATDHRRKRSRKLDQQPPLVQQPKDKKRRQDTLDLTHNNSAAAPRKRARRSTRNTTVDIKLDNRKRRRLFPANSKAVNPKSTNPSHTSNITQWVLGVARDTAESQGQPEDHQDYLHNMHRFLAEQKVVQRKRSSSSIASSSHSDQGYQDARYATKLEANGGFMREYRGELPDKANIFNDEFRRMLEKEQSMPKDSLFSDDYFEDTMDMIQDRNEAFIIETISQLMFPHVQAMTIRGAKHLNPFIQSFDEGWNNCKKITQTRPQPDSAIGFRATEFSPEQLEKLQPYLGDLEAKSDFRATFYMYFPFLTYEVKRGNIGLDIADRQNAHSMTIAVRGLVALFRLVRREQEVHGKMLTISVSFDHRMARVYGYLPIIKGHNTEVWREEIDAFDFRTRKGRYKWKCLQYSLNALDAGLQLLKLIRSAIDDWTPDPELGALPLSETPSSRPSGLSQILNDHDISDEKESIFGTGDANDTTPDTSFTSGGASKKPRKRLTAGQ